MSSLVFSVEETSESHDPFGTVSLSYRTHTSTVPVAPWTLTEGMTGNQRVMGFIPVRDSEDFSTRTKLKDLFYT